MYNSGSRERYNLELVEVQPQFIRMFQVISPDGARVEVDASQVHDPEKLGRVAHNDLSSGSPGGKPQSHRFDPLRARGRSSLLEEGLAGGAIHVTLEHNGTTGDAPQGPIGDREVVPRQVEPGVAGLCGMKNNLLRFPARVRSMCGSRVVRVQWPTADVVLRSDQMADSGSSPSLARPASCYSP